MKNPFIVYCFNLRVAITKQITQIAFYKMLWYVMVILCYGTHVCHFYATLCCAMIYFFKNDMMQGTSDLMWIFLY